MQSKFIIVNVNSIKLHFYGFQKSRYSGVGRTLFRYVQHHVRPTPYSHSKNTAIYLNKIWVGGGFSGNMRSLIK